MTQKMKAIKETKALVKIPLKAKELCLIQINSLYLFNRAFKKCQDSTSKISDQRTVRGETQHHFAGRLLSML